MTPTVFLTTVIVDIFHLLWFDPPWLPAPSASSASSAPSPPARDGTLLIDLFGCPQDITPGVRKLRFLLVADCAGPPPSAPEIRSLLTPMPVDQLRAVASFISLDVPSGRWNAAVRGAKVVNPLVSLCVRVFSAHQTASALSLPVRK